jgi:Na+-transporting NADH:ubiquinone oxidoreductase subunit NqrF
LLSTSVKETRFINKKIGGDLSWNEGFIGVQEGGGEVVASDRDTLAERRKNRSGVGMIFQNVAKELRQEKKQEALRDYIRENIELKKLLAREREDNEILKAALDFFGTCQKG